MEIIHVHKTANYRFTLYEENGEMYVSFISESHAYDSKVDRFKFYNVGKSIFSKAIYNDDNYTLFNFLLIN